MAKQHTDYALYDGRYPTEPDRAIVFEICDTLREARQNRKEYGDDTCIVKVTCDVQKDGSYLIVKEELLKG